VTNRLYTCFIKETNYKPPENWNNGSISKNKEDHPVVNVTLYDADTYKKWLGQKCNEKIAIPTEAQWEKAARGTDERKFPWGNEAPNDNLSNYHKKIRDTTTVDSYPRGVSPYSAMDMAGNVWDWVNDWYDRSYYSVSPLNNPTGPTIGNYKVIRGGSWSRDSSRLRTANRFFLNPAKRNTHLGFRCAISS